MTADMFNFRRPEEVKSFKRRIRNGSAVLASGATLGLIAAGGVRLLGDITFSGESIGTIVKVTEEQNCRPYAPAYVKELVGANAKIEIIKSAGFACLRLKSTGEAWGQSRNMSLGISGDVQKRETGDFKMYAGWLTLPVDKCASVHASAEPLPTPYQALPTAIEADIRVCYESVLVEGSAKQFNVLVTE